jgi:hypothetical protein
MRYDGRDRAQESTSLYLCAQLKAMAIPNDHADWCVAPPIQRGAAEEWSDDIVVPIQRRRRHEVTTLRSTREDGTKVIIGSPFSVTARPYFDAGPSLVNLAIKPMAR